MKSIKESAWIGPVISGLLAFLAVAGINFIASWFLYIPLFISLTVASAGGHFKKGFLFGIVFGSIALFWMIPGAERFTGHSIIYGIAVFLVSILFFGLYHGIVLYLFAMLKQSGNGKRSLVYNTILIAASMVAGESLIMYVSRSFPWFDYHSGNGLAENLYSVQPASVAGIHLLSFITVAVNYLTAAYIERVNYKKLYIPAGIFAAYLLCGFLLLKTFDKSVNKQTPFNLAILAENIMPDIKWDDKNGNMLVNKLLELNRSATASKPGMILWSESAIPWTYRKDDDLVNEILKTTNPSGISHLLGINTEITGNEIYNSAYSIMPGGKVAGRYDKQWLLGLIEQPIKGFIMPFFSSDGFIAKKNPAHAGPLATAYGKAGIFICNEAAVPEAAANKCRKGAGFLCNMSNDGWFNDTYIVNLHFYFDRLRAVESRKDLAINCNNGYSGLIKASGRIEEMRRDDQPFVQLVTIEPNNSITLASIHPRWFAYACMLFLVFAVSYKRINATDFK